MDDWLAEYENAESLHRKYDLLRAEMARLRGEAHAADDGELFDPAEVAASLRSLDDSLDGDLIAFVANDFGRPIAFRPDGVPRGAQAEIREAILQAKYDTDEELNDIRETLLDRFPAVHKAIVAEYGADGIRYHLPEGSNGTTNFLTVREMVGLVDYTTNSAQRDGLSQTY
jgi:hypothetical protein